MAFCAKGALLHRYKVVRENTVLLPTEGTSIEVQWTDQDENYLKWFTAVVVKPDVTRLEARQEKRFDRLAKCEVPPNPVHRVAE